MRSTRNPFNLRYTEKSAIKGHSVDRYNYAIQLLNENTNDALIKAYTWLSLAADEIDMSTEAGRLKNKVAFELKQRELFEDALKIEVDYRAKYSADALIAKIKNSRNPIHLFSKFLIYITERKNKT